MKLVIMGPPGSGKGTQAVKLAQQFNLCHISTGDLFREARRQETPLGKLVKEIMDKGELVSDELTTQVLENRLSKEDAKKGFVLDGYPRNLSQLNSFNEITNIDFVIELIVRDEEVVRRITSRRTCEACGAIFNTIFIKPMKPGICDKCQRKLVQREDAKPEVVKERLRIYHDQTDPITKSYMEKGILLRINGEQPIQKVFEDILKKLN